MRQVKAVLANQRQHRPAGEVQSQVGEPDEERPKVVVVVANQLREVTVRVERQSGERGPGLLVKVAGGEEHLREEAVCLPGTDDVQGGQLGEVKLGGGQFEAERVEGDQGQVAQTGLPTGGQVVEEGVQAAGESI